MMQLSELKMGHLQEFWLMKKRQPLWELSCQLQGQGLKQDWVLGLEKDLEDQICLLGAEFFPV